MINDMQEKDRHRDVKYFDSVFYIFPSEICNFNAIWKFYDYTKTVAFFFFDKLLMSRDKKKG